MKVSIFNKTPVLKSEVVYNIKEMLHTANKFQSSVDSRVFNADAAIELVEKHDVVTDEMLLTLSDEERNILTMCWQDVFFALPENQPTKQSVELKPGQSFMF